MRIGVLDYGAGNLETMLNALDFIDHKAVRIEIDQNLGSVDGILIPGVGSFPHAMKRLDGSSIRERLLEHMSSTGPVIGICLGMQLLFESSEEDGGSKGLGLLSGRVVESASLFSRGQRGYRVGWRQTVFSNSEPSSHLYYAHSFEVVDVEDSHVKAISKNGNRDVISAVAHGNLVGLQFHPEKSGQRGLQLLAKAIAGQF